MNEPHFPITPEELGHTIYSLMEDVARLCRQPETDPEAIDATRSRLGMYVQAVDALHRDFSVRDYDYGLRSAVMTHLSTCETVAPPPFVMLAPESATRVQTQRARASEIRRGADFHELDDHTRVALADLFEAHASLAEALRNSDEPCLIFVDGLLPGMTTNASSAAAASVGETDTHPARTQTADASEQDPSHVEDYGWECDECYNVIPGPDTFSVEHSKACSLHPDNSYGPDHATPVIWTPVGTARSETPDSPAVLAPQGE